MPIPSADLTGQGVQEDQDIERPSENDLLILRAIGGDSDAQNVSFQGIKRKLGLHQETLSRALHRLSRDGFIERLEQGYRISNKGRASIVSETPILAEPDYFGDRYPISVLSAMLPEDVNVQDVVASLSYKWFGNLRWLGFGESRDSTTMSWITSDSDLKLTVKIKGDALTIESFANKAGAATKAIMSAYELFDHVTKVLKLAETGKEEPQRHAGSAA